MTETLPRNYDTIPGTFVFDGKRARRGHPLNRLCMTLNDPANRDHFRRDPEAYMARFGLSNEQRDAVRRRDWISMLELGGNIYFTAKLGATDGHSFQHMAAVMTGATQEDYAAMMLKGGRSVEGNRSKSGKDKIVKAKARTTAKSKAKAKPKTASKKTSSKGSKRRG